MKNIVHVDMSNKEAVRNLIAAGRECVDSAQRLCNAIDENSEIVKAFPQLEEFLLLVTRSRMSYDEALDDATIDPVIISAMRKMSGAQ